MTTLAALIASAPPTLGFHWASEDEPCPFPTTDANGGQLVRWGIGPLGAFAEYVPVMATPDCCFCRKPVRVWKGTGGEERCIAVTENGMVWAHALCRQKAKGRTVTAMATAEALKDLPDCRLCGLPFRDGHFVPLGSIWDAYCDTESLPDVQQFYQPATPFRSRSGRLIAGYDHDNGRVLFLDEPAQEHAAA